MPERRCQIQADEFKALNLIALIAIQDAVQSIGDVLESKNMHNSKEAAALVVQSHVQMVVHGIASSNDCRSGSVKSLHDTF